MPTVYRQTAAGHPLAKATSIALLWLLLPCAGLLFSGQAIGDARSACLLDAIDRAPERTTVGELKARCDIATARTPQQVPDGPPLAVSGTAPAQGNGTRQNGGFRGRIAAEQQSLDRSYSLTPHQPNYLIPYSRRNDPNHDGLPDQGGRLQKQEAVLQVSMKFPLWRRVLRTENDLLFSYTSRSWFQAYNSALSKPFRETNYEPEIFWRHYGDIDLPFGVAIAGWDLGWNHQSNGRSEPLSRSWDRILARVALDITPNLSASLRAWYRIPEDADKDDNPDIHRYMGYGDIRAIWTPNRNTFTALFRPGTEENGFELTWSYPVTKHFRIYTQYYNGYGESLIDYNRRVQRIGIGFAINDFLQTP